MQNEKIDKPFKNWKSIVYYESKIKKAIESNNNHVIERFISFFKIDRINTLRQIIPYAFSGFSIILIGYVLLNIFTNYPPREIGISP